ncbi:relaxase/mobilization nuclease domain-containing protein [Fulvivirga lutea]|uniref:Relaxase/mobilization nuclease domain-containing protein n=1 Tax=Fulvivirga lutea TaxID=2810512 RepID=A0A974WK54_9BACT|nr:relaxase/mobilization nuclease domain-containing protein [Fulvivirga lutea]QSE98642.1 relaxase/mobilization nuclease domain-containing protein [Fulvivirga lutea]
MIIKVLPSPQNLYKSVDYLVQKAKGTEVIYVNGVQPDCTIGEMVQEFELVASLAGERLQHKYLHSTLAFDVNDFPNGITNDKMVEYSLYYLQQMGFTDENQVAIFLHHDRDETHYHCHVTANRVDVNGKIVSDSFSKIQTLEIITQLEDLHDLPKHQDRINQRKEDALNLVRKVGYLELDEARNRMYLEEVLRSARYKLYINKYKSDYRLTVCEMGSLCKWKAFYDRDIFNSVSRQNKIKNDKSKEENKLARGAEKGL